MRWILVVVALVGCDSVFGLDPITPHDAGVDAPGDESMLVTGSIVQRYATNNSSYAPVVDTRVLAPGAFVLSAKLDDGTLPPVTYLADGTFSFQLEHPGQRFSVITSAFGHLETTVTHLAFASMVAGRLDARPLAGATYLTFPFPTPGPYQSAAYLVTAGQFSSTYTGLSGFANTFDWQLAAPIGGAPLGLLDGSRHDLAYLVQYQGNFTDPGGGELYSAIDAYSATPVTQEVGGTAALNPVSPVGPFNACLWFSTQDATEFKRLETGLPPRMYTPLTAWYVYWVPSADQLGTIAAVSLASSSSSTPTDYKPMPSFEQPFPGGSLVVTSVDYDLFYVSAPGATGTTVQLAALSQRLIELGAMPPASCTGGALGDLTGHVAIPSLPSLDGVLLDTTYKQIASPSGVVTWTQAAAGPVHYTSVELFELYAINNDSFIQDLGAIATMDQTAHFDPSLFLVGHTYLIVVVTHLNFPNASSGDFSAFGYPLENGEEWSEPFTVVASH